MQGQYLASPVASPSAMIKLDRTQRDVLRGDAVTSLYASGEDLIGAPDRDDLSFFLKIRKRVEAALWLLDDLGWKQEDERDVFYVTLPLGMFRWYVGEMDEYATAELTDAAAALADPVKGFRLSIEFGEESLAECIAEARADADRHLDYLAVCHALSHAIDTASAAV